METDIYCYLSTVALLGQEAGFPYDYSSSNESDGVITDFSCTYKSTCPHEIVDESSCANFGGDAVVTCVIGTM